MDDSITTGGCLCGAVRYEARGVPYHVTHCHCEDCRRSTGAVFVTWASFRSEGFAFVKGQPKQVRWAGRVRSFCPECGTQLAFQTDPGADEIDLTVASFDRPESVTPADHIWTVDRLPWIAIQDGLPVFGEDRD